MIHFINSEVESDVVPIKPKTNKKTHYYFQGQLYNLQGTVQDENVEPLAPRVRNKCIKSILTRKRKSFFLSFAVFQPGLLFLFAI